MLERFIPLFLQETKFQSLFLKALNMFLCLTLLCCTACSRKDLPAPFGPKPYVVNNVYSSAVLPANTQRVAVLPVCFSDILPLQQLKNFDEIFTGELLKQKRFEVVSVERDWLKKRFNESQFSSADLLPQDFLNIIKESMQADALMFIEITHYNPYKPIALGVRCKLLTFSDRKIVWAVDELFNIGSPSVYKAFENYQEQQGVTNFSLTYDDTLFCTPDAFAHYAAYEVFSRLPRPLN